jgi:hypothetical protein
MKKPVKTTSGQLETEMNGVVFYKKIREARNMFGGGTVWCGGRGCLCGGPMLKHPSPPPPGTSQMTNGVYSGNGEGS